MTFRFRRTLKILPGVRLNLGKKGVSASVGVRGLSVTTGRKGTHLNVGAPGTGLSYRTNLKTLLSKNDSDQPATKTKLPLEVSLSLNNRLKLHLRDASSREKLTDDQRAAFIKTNQTRIQEWLEEQAKQWNEAIFSIADLHLERHGEGAKNESAALGIEIPSLPERPQNPPLDAPRIPEQFASKSYRRAFSRTAADDQRKLLVTYQIRHSEWLRKYCTLIDQRDSARQEYRKASASWRESRTEAYARLAGEPEYVGEVLGRRFENLEWPRETNVEFSVSDDSRLVIVDIDLPEIEDMPQNLFQVSDEDFELARNKMSAQKIAALYRDHVTSIAVRASAVSFATAPTIERVIVSGYTQRETVGGPMNDDYVISLDLTRETYMFELAPLIRKQRLEPMIHRDWCRISEDHDGRLDVINPFQQ